VALMQRSAVLEAGPRVAPAANPLVALWRFGRPHTVIGTLTSIAALYLIAVSQDVAPGVGDLFWTMVAGYGVNVFIVGINQITDVEIDRINKPYLPIAAGDLTMTQAWLIVGVCGFVPVALALTQGTVELVGVLAGLAVGVLYSVPPFRLKRFPALASLCISGVRAVVVNLAVYAHFAGSIAGPVWALTLFVAPFSFAIAIFKDVPDIEGDRRYQIATFTLRLGGRRVMAMGVGALVVAYLGMAVLGPLLLGGDVQPLVLAGGNLAALAVALVAARRTDVGDRASFWRFYMRVWMLFFAEYALMAVACLAA
jgi:homogentisate phytyltransferase/homogentisate geranylgeranyltransferase